MYVGHSLTRARAHAQANANRDGRPRWIYGDSVGGFRILWSEPSGHYGGDRGIRVEPQTPIQTREGEYFQSQDLARDTYRREHQDRKG